MRTKRIMVILLVTVMIMSMLFASCGTQGANGTKTKVGMATDSGTIDDKSFNQGTWEGIKKYEKDKGTIEAKYLQPSGEQHTDYLNAINDLVDTGYKIIITPGYKFETAVNEAAGKHTDATFVLLDGSTHLPDNYDFVKHDNVVCVFFQENEAGFLVGIASALSTKTNKVAFIGGQEIPPVQRFGWGFKAGVKYANDNLGTKAEVVDYIYQGTFNDTPAGQTLAAGMYNKGIDIIFAAAGGVGVGVFNEAKQRGEKGEKVYVVGVDSDQYNAGLLSDKKTSVTLTSAMKRVDVAAYDYIDAKLNNKFPGGEIITLTLADNALGLPEKNPNLTDDILKKVEAARKDVVDKKFTVPATQEELDAYLK